MESTMGLVLGIAIMLMPLFLLTVGVLRRRRMRRKGKHKSGAVALTLWTIGAIILPPAVILMRAKKLALLKSGLALLAMPYLSPAPQLAAVYIVWRDREDWGHERNQ